MDIPGLLPGVIDMGGFALLAIIVAAAGFVSGLSGFGFSAIGAASLWVLPPEQAISLLMALSTVNQMMSLSELRASLKPLREWWPSGPAPYILGGLAGLPAGLWALRELPSAALCAAVGAVLLVYSGWSAFKPAGLRVKSSSPVAALAVGTLGGVIGGFTAFPGGAIVAWAGLLGMGKLDQRAVVQPYILTMQLAALSMLAAPAEGHASVFGAGFWVLFLGLVPVVLPFTKLGVWVFRKISDIDFKRMTHGLLAISGAGLSVKGASTVLALWGWVKVTAMAAVLPLLTMDLPQEVIASLAFPSQHSAPLILDVGLLGAANWWPGLDVSSVDFSEVSGR